MMSTTSTRTTRTRTRTRTTRLVRVPLIVIFTMHLITQQVQIKAFAPNINIWGKRTRSSRYDFFVRSVATSPNVINANKQPSATVHKSAISPPQKSNIQGKEFPFNMIVDQKDLKEAAVIAASNPQAAGILIGGRHGTGKSVMARAIHQLLPKTIERVKGSLYNVDPSGQYGIDTFLLQDLIRNGSDINDLEMENFQTPFVHIPLNIMEDSLCGTVDIEQSMISGETVFSPGLLAKAHRGILYIDDIHLLDDNILSILFDVVSDGWVMIEREGMR